MLLTGTSALTVYYPLVTRIEYLSISAQWQSLSVLAAMSGTLSLGYRVYSILVSVQIGVRGSTVVVAVLR